MIHATIQSDFQSWRDRARRLLVAGIPPQMIIWSDDRTGTSALPSIAADLSPVGVAKPPSVPAEFVSTAKTVSMHRDPDRWALLYRVLFRLTHEEPDLLHVTVDDEVHKLLQMAKQVRRDIHKMHAFVRFRKIDDESGEHFIAWHRPDHYIVPSTAPWFSRRFATMRWTILTPDASASWDTNTVTYGPGVPASAAPGADELEDLWRGYYRAIFNPARVKIKAMKKELPVRHWATLPEADLIDELIRQAPQRVEVMVAKSKAETACANTASAADFVPAVHKLSVLREAAAGCKGCDLYCAATQTVFGEGPDTAEVMFVGEQPGDKEDIAGTPFVGPAGQMLDKGLEDAGIDRSQVYVTNAVKHFKFEPRGKARIHAKPNAREMAACRPWLEAEIASVRPKLIVCLGATAAQSLMGPQFRITKDRGIVFADTQWAPALIATNHPSAILRVPDPNARQEAYHHFVHDLNLVRDQMQKITRESANASARRMPAHTATAAPPEVVEQGKLF